MRFLRHLATIGAGIEPAATTPALCLHSMEYHDAGIPATIHQFSTWLQRPAAAVLFSERGQRRVADAQLDEGLAVALSGLRDPIAGQGKPEIGACISPYDALDY